MEAPKSLEIARDLTLQKIGRNLVNFQRAEAALKLLLQSTWIETTASSVKTALPKKTPMGPLVDPTAAALFFGTERADSSGQEADEIRVTTTFRIEGGSELEQSWKEEIRAIVDERIRLVHHLLGGFDEKSEESCRRLSIELDAQRERVLPSVNRLISLANEAATLRREAIEAIKSEYNL